MAKANLYSKCAREGKRLNFPRLKEALRLWADAASAFVDAEFESARVPEEPLGAYKAFEILKVMTRGPARGGFEDLSRLRAPVGWTGRGGLFADHAQLPQTVNRCGAPEFCN